MLDTEFIPAQDRSSRRLMVVLHGLGDSIEGYRWLPQALRLPWLNHLLVNAPDPYYMGYSWYDFEGDAATGIVRSRRLLLELLERTSGQGYAPGDTLVFGFSQGCLMTIEVGLHYPNRLAGLIGISGHVHEVDDAVRNLTPVAKQQRFLITHGAWDSLLPLARTRGEIRQLQAAGLQIDWREFAKDHTIAGDEEIDVIRNFVAGSWLDQK
jgi:phospholipase/carboxylesterase